jgi:putative ABC transport system permease protein
MRLAWRNLIQERTRLALSVLGVALAIVLILLLQGFLSGMFRQIAAYLVHSPGTVVVAQDGVVNLLGATSLLPQGAAEDAAKVSGVSGVVPILSQFVILDLHGKKQPAYLIGYDPAAGGGPWRMAEGTQPQGDDDVVIDRVLAQRHGLYLGDRFEIMDRGFTIVGLSDETASWMTSFLFLSKTAAEGLVRVPGATSFLLVTPAAGEDTQSVRRDLGEIPGAQSLLKTEMIANDSKLFGKLFSAPIRLMAGIAFLVGTLVVGLITYTATVERRREYGVLKAIGASNRVLYRVVIVQALVAAVAGSLTGIGLAIAAAKAIMDLRPQFLIVLEPQAVGFSIVAGLLMACLAALLPARLLGNLPPAEVFRR